MRRIIEQFYLNPSLFLAKAAGRVRKRFAVVPLPNTKQLVAGHIWFDFSYSKFLDLDDLKAMCSGAYELGVVRLIKSYLESGDTFIDVGANIGYMSAVAASVVGPEGEIHAFEPLVPCYARLLQLPELNTRHKFFLNNSALGERPGEAHIAYSLDGDSRNATLVPGIRDCTHSTVKVQRLDEYIFSKVEHPERIKLIKIDVEGFELPVLKGLAHFFQKTPHRPAIICEIKPWDLKRIGSSLHEFQNYMEGYSYNAYSIVKDSLKRDLTALRNLEVVVFRADQSAVPDSSSGNRESTLRAAAGGTLTRS